MVADGYTLGRAAGGEFARGRPTKFLCVECFAHYDFSQVAYHEDHRGHREGKLYRRRTIRLPFGQARIEEITEP